MKQFLICALALGALAPVLRAEEASKDKPLSPGEEYKALAEEYQTAQREYFQAYSKAKTSQERAEARKKRPIPSQYAGRFLELAEKHSDDPAAAEALVWVVSQVRSGDDVDRALQELAKNHGKSDKLGPVCQSLAYSQSAVAEEFLRGALANSPHASVKGLACFSLAQYLKRQSSMIEYVKNQPEIAARIEQYYGKPYADRLRSLNAEQVAEETEALFDRGAKEFAGISYGRGTIGEAAERELFEIRHLAVGCVAPEIEGEDIEGVKFSLADYRGKVVMLDFWGNW